MGRVITIILASFVLIGVDSATQQTAEADHFASRRRDAELRRRQAVQAPKRRPWGGPTTGRAFWKPVQPGQHTIVNTRSYVAPGRFVWFGGRRIYVPYQRYTPYPIYSPYSPYVFSGPQHIYIERYIQR